MGKKREGKILRRESRRVRRGERNGKKREGKV